MHPKFLLISSPDKPLKGRFIYGMVALHKDLFESYVKIFGYGKIHGGGWYRKDDDAKTMTLYGNSGDYGAPRLEFLNLIPEELRDYKFFWSPGWNLPVNELPLEDVEWV